MTSTPEKRSLSTKSPGHPNTERRILPGNGRRGALRKTSLVPLQSRPVPRERKTDDLIWIENDVFYAQPLPGISDVDEAFACLDHSGVRKLARSVLKHKRGLPFPGFVSSDCCYIRSSQKIISLAVNDIKKSENQACGQALGQGNHLCL